ncbi:hypothetical protein L873DRAFT_725235 [Choiromyces venosus 120613-1]|uniref:Uncharacterized protein n=1 Tax=Choiromyces venosus 120613-1 TaxID=1336337 RepID=A0A3N4JUY0_9PEZI|nr:hypothetical protein L873DRAFT_725235 [Choiromyces venosus 120613-1]
MLSEYYLFIFSCFLVFSYFSFFLKKGEKGALRCVAEDQIFALRVWPACPRFAILGGRYGTTSTNSWPGHMGKSIYGGWVNCGHGEGIWVCGCGRFGERGREEAGRRGFLQSPQRKSQGREWAEFWF